MLWGTGWWWGVILALGCNREPHGRLSVPDRPGSDSARRPAGWRDIDWIEERVRADDYAGHAAVAAAARTPVQMGENWWGPHGMATSVDAGASGWPWWTLGRFGA